MKALFGVYAAAFIFVVSSAAAGPKEDATAVDQQWTSAFNSGDAAAIIALYDADARLHPTVSPKRMDGKEAILGYFNRVFSIFPTRSMTFKDEDIREVSPNVIVNTGFYDLSVTNKEGQAQQIPARYSIVLVNKGGKWLIADHHSSVVPAP